MLIINIVLDEIHSSYTGQIVLYLNTGGVRKAVVEEERFLKFNKLDSTKPRREILESPRST